MAANPLAFLRRHPSKTALASILVIFFLAAGIGRLETRMDPYAEGGSAVSSQKWLALEEKEFQDAHAIMLFIHREDRAWKASEICALELWGERWAQSDSSVRSWMTPLRIRQAQRHAQKLLFPKVVEWDCNKPESLTGKTWNEGVESFRAPPWKNFLVGSSREYAIQFTFDDTKSASGDYSYDDVRRAYRGLSTFTREKFPEAAVILAGPSAFSFFLEETLRQDAWVMILLFAVLAVALRAFIGTWRASFIYFATLAFTFSGLFGLMGWLGIPVNVLTNCLALMTAIAGIEDFIFISAAQDAGLENGAEFAHVAGPGFWTTLTTAIGFWSLGVSDVEIIRDFGIAAGFGAMLEWMVLFLVLPSVCAAAPAALSWMKRWTRADRVWIRVRTRGFRVRARWIPWSVTVIGIIAGLVAYQYVVYDENPSQNFPAAHAQARAARYLERNRGWTGQIDVLFLDGTDPTATIEKISRVRGVKQIDDETRFLNFMTSGLGDEDARAVRQEYGSSRLQEVYVSRNGLRRAFLLTEPESVSGLKSLVADIRGICQLPACALAGKTVSYLDVTDDVVDTLLRSFLTSLFWVSILILCLARFHRSGSYPQLILTALWGPFVMIAIVSIFRIEMNLMTCIFAAVIVGLSGDNAIHYIFASRGRGLSEGTRSQGAASIILAVTLSLCCLTMFAQTLKPLHTLGGLLSVAFLVSLVGDFGLITALLSDDATADPPPTSPPAPPPR